MYYFLKYMEKKGFETPAWECDAVLAGLVCVTLQWHHCIQQYQVCLQKVCSSSPGGSYRVFPRGVNSVMGKSMYVTWMPLLAVGLEENWPM